MKYYIIACKVMEREMRQFESRDSHFVFLDQGLHKTPNKLRKRIQEEIEGVSRKDDCFILLGYGLCGNGLDGIEAGPHPLIVPAVDDCISLFLGSTKRYLKEFRKAPGTYFLSPGWIEEGDTPLALYEQCVKKYGTETADWIIQEEFKHYQRIALIDTKVCPIHGYMKEAERNAEFLGLKCQEIAGSLSFIEKLMSGNWDDDFFVIEKGQKVTQKMFLFRMLNKRKDEVAASTF